MAIISKDEVRRLAKLAKISLREEEVLTLQRELAEIFAMIERLNKIDTTDIEPTSQVTGLEDVTRDDKIGTEIYGCHPDDLLKCPAVVEDRQVRVPKVI